MTVQNPPLYLQGANHPAEDFRHLISATFGGRPGVVRGGLEVTEKAGTANMSVDVAEGSVLVEGSEASYQGLYLCQNRGVTNLAISASDPTNDRYDLIVAQVEDSDYSGATDAWKLDVVTGTAAATPLFPAVPDNAFVLATVLVQNAVSSIVDADITDVRDGSDTDGTTTLVNRGGASLPGVIVCTSSTRPSSPFTGMQIYETDEDRVYIWNGSGWILTSGKLPYALVSRLSSHSLATGSETTITFDTGTIDPDGLWDGSTAIEAPMDGMYVVSGSTSFQQNATGYRYAGIQINGSWVTLDSVNGVSGLRTHISFSVVRRITSGSTVEMAVRQTSGSTLSLENSGPGNRLAIQYIGDYIS